MPKYQGPDDPHLRSLWEALHAKRTRDRPDLKDLFEGRFDTEVDDDYLKALRFATAYGMGPEKFKEEWEGRFRPVDAPWNEPKMYTHTWSAETGRASSVYTQGVPYHGTIEFFDPDHQEKYCCRFDWPLAGLYSMLPGSTTIIIHKEKTYEEPREFMQAQFDLIQMLMGRNISYAAGNDRRLTL